MLGQACEASQLVPRLRKKLNCTDSMYVTWPVNIGAWLSSFQMRKRSERQGCVLAVTARLKASSGHEEFVLHVFVVPGPHVSHRP